MSNVHMPPRLGEFPPSPDVPPRTIFASSSAEDVKLWVYHFIIRNQPYMTHKEAWLLAREVKGVGEYALQYNKAQWENEVPGWGALIYLALHETPKYVIDAIFDVLLVAQTFILFVAGGAGVFTIITKTSLETTKIIGFVFIGYTFTLRLIQAILSSPWAHQWKKYPDALKLRRSRDGFWKDFAGIPK